MAKRSVLKIVEGFQRSNNKELDFWKQYITSHWLHQNLSAGRYKYGIYRIRVKVVHQNLWKLAFMETIAQWETFLVVPEINDAVSH